MFCKALLHGKTVWRSKRVAKTLGGGFLDTGVGTRGRERKGEGHLLLCGGWLLDWVTGCVIVVLRQAEAGWDAATATYYSRGRS